MSDNYHQFKIFQVIRGSEESDGWANASILDGTVNCNILSDMPSYNGTLPEIPIEAGKQETKIWLELAVSLLTVEGDKQKIVLVEDINVMYGTDPTSEGWDDFPYQPNPTEDGLIPDKAFILIASVKRDEQLETLLIDQRVKGSLYLSQIGFDLYDISLGGGMFEKGLKKRLVFSEPDNFDKCIQGTSGSSSKSSVSSSSSSSSSQSSPSSSGKSSAQSSAQSSAGHSSGGPSMPSHHESHHGSKTAIVPYGKKNVGLFCVEAPDVIFEDNIKVYTSGETTVIRRLDEIFQQVCEEDSIRIVSVFPSSPAYVGGLIKDDLICVEVIPAPSKGVPDFLNIKVSGIRKGFAGVRFPKFTKEQMVKNNKFWDSASQIKD